jgi:glycine/D-amino acid oxidase-like deaminating enzyme
LRRSRPVWADSSGIAVRTRTEPAHTRYDLIIVGAGVSGALMAHGLTRGRRVLILDRRPPLTGSTMASTALIQHDIDVPLFRLSKMIGERAAVEVWRESASAVRALKRIVRKERIACEWRDSTTLYLAGSKYGVDDLAKEYALRKQAGLSCRLMDGKTLAAGFNIRREGALLSTPAASANPARLTAGLLRWAKRHGAEIASPVNITAVHETAEQVVLATDSGQLISGARVVFCSGYEVLKSLAHEQHRILTTWAIASRPGLRLPPWLYQHVVWEGADPYLYMRATADGRVIAGGEDEENAEAVVSVAKREKKARVIARKVEELIGLKLGEPEYSWSAAFGSTRSGLPLMGRVPGHKRLFAVMGFGGNGITFSQIAAQLVKRQILDHPGKTDVNYAL